MGEEEITLVILGVKPLFHDITETDHLKVEYLKKKSFHT